MSEKERMVIPFLFIIFWFGITDSLLFTHGRLGQVINRELWVVQRFKTVPGKEVRERGGRERQGQKTGTRISKKSDGWTGRQPVPVLSSFPLPPFHYTSFQRASLPSCPSYTPQPHIRKRNNRQAGEEGRDKIGNQWIIPPPSTYYFVFYVMTGRWERFIEDALPSPPAWTTVSVWTSVYFSGFIWVTSKTETVFQGGLGHHSLHTRQ